MLDGAAFGTIMRLASLCSVGAATAPSIAACNARFYRSSWQRCAPLCTCAGVELEVGTGQPAGHRPPGCRDEARALCAIALGDIDHSHQIHLYYYI